jgi:hypothetical protein
MQLALADAHDAGAEVGSGRQVEINRAYANQIQRLAEYLVSCGHDEEALLDCAPAQIVDRAIGLINIAQAQAADVANWLAANMDIELDGGTPLAQAISALTALSDIVAAQNAALTTLAETRLGLDRRLAKEGAQIQELLAEKDRLRNKLILLQQGEKIVEPVVDAPAALASPNGNGKTAPALATPPAAKATMPPGLSAIAEEYWQGCERGAHPFRKLPLEIRLEIVQAVLGSLAGDGAAACGLAAQRHRRPHRAVKRRREVARLRQVVESSAVAPALAASPAFR